MVFVVKEDVLVILVVAVALAIEVFTYLTTLHESFPWLISARRSSGGSVGGA